MHRPSLPAPAGLRHRLVASVWTIPAVVLPIVAASLAWFAYAEYLQTLEQEYRFLEAHARIADGQISGLLRNSKQLLRRIAEEGAAVPATQRAAYDAKLAERKQEIPELHTLVVTDADGRILMTDNPALKAFDASQREYFVAHRDQVRQPNFFISRPFKTPFGDHAVAFSVALRDAAGRFHGVVATGVNYKYFDTAVKQIKPPGIDSVVAIVNQDGDVIYRQPDPDKYIGSNIGASPAFKRFKQSGQPMGRSIAVSRLDGTERIYVHHSIANTPLCIVMARPLDAVLAAWYRNVLLRVLMFVAAAAVTLYLARLAQRRQNEVLAAKEFSEQLIATANVMVVGLDEAGNVIIFNRAAEQITGYLREEMLGRNWCETAIPSARFPLACAAFRSFVEAGDMPQAFDAPILAKNGEERLVAFQNSTIREHGLIVARISFGIDVTERHQAEEAKRNAEVSRRLVFAQEDERRRLAVELHDRAGPNLAALGINVKRLADSLPTPVTKAQQQMLADTSMLLDETIAAIRSISIDFRPPLLDYAGLWPALEGYVQRFSRRTGIAVHAWKNDLEQRLAPEIETNLFRIAQEALANCAQYSGAKTVHIQIRCLADEVEFSIADDGTGFDPHAEPQLGTAGQGLATMRKRAEFIGGKFSLESAPGKGTRVTVRFTPAVASVATPQTVPPPA